MAERPTSNVPGENRLLAALPADERERLIARMERVSLGLKDLIYEVNGPVEHVHFPLTAMFSLLVVMSDELAVEAATIGNEGMVGMPLFLGADRSPQRAFAQVPGESLRMAAGDFLEETERGGPLHRVLRKYNLALMSQMAQSVACNRLHSVEERMARWLLMTHDRVGADQFPLTQEFLAQMLGVRRPTVTVTAGVLESAGLIAVGRGRITILNRARLEAASCECYRVVKVEFDRLLA
jgi:CRP-like cAMP-binding protein